MDRLGLTLRKQFIDAEVRRPNFFIVGAPKCATTSMAASLARHPDIFMTTPKEPHVFGSDLSALRARMEPDDYVDLFRGAVGESRLGEASVWYLRSKLAAREIREFCPDARIIVMLRNPVDMLYSLHAQSVKSGIEHIRDFRAALDAETDRLQGKQIRRGVRQTRQLLYSEAVAYASQLERYFHYFDRRAVKVILFDTVVSDPSTVIRETQEFLEVSALEGLPFVRLNEGGQVRIARLQRLMRNPDILRSVSRAFLPKAARLRIAAHVVPRVERINVVADRRPRLSEAVRSELTERFRPEVERLGVLLKEDLSVWLEPEHASGPPASTETKSEPRSPTADIQGARPAGL